MKLTFPLHILFALMIAALGNVAYAQNLPGTKKLDTLAKTDTLKRDTVQRKRNTLAKSAGKYFQRLKNSFSGVAKSEGKDRLNQLKGVKNQATSPVVKLRDSLNNGSKALQSKLAVPKSDINADSLVKEAASQKAQEVKSGVKTAADDEKKKYQEEAKNAKEKILSSPKLLDSAKNKAVAGFKDKFSLPNDSTRKAALKGFSDKQLERMGLKRSKDDSSAKKSAIVFNKIAVQNSTLYSNASDPFQKSGFINSVGVSGQIQLFKMPLALDLANNAPELGSVKSMKDALFKVNFDRAQMSQLYQGNLNKYTDFKKKELSGMEVSTALRSKALQKLSPASGIKLKEYPKMQSFLNDRKQVEAMLKLDDKAIKQKVDELMTQEKNALTAEGKAVSKQLKDTSAVELRKKEAELEQKKAALEKKKAEVTEVFVSMKGKINDAGLDPTQVQLLQNFISHKGSTKDMEALLENEIKNADQQTTFQKAYSRVRSLQAGNFGQKIPGSFLNRDVFMNGFDLAVKTGRGPVELGVGSNKTIGMPKDGTFDHSLFDFPKFLTYLSIPTNSTSFGQGKLSWVGSYDKRTNGSFNQINNTPKTSMAFTVSQLMDFQKMGNVTFELSKSAVQYKNIASMEMDKVFLNNDIHLGRYFRDDFTETLSMGLKHSGTFKKLGLQSNVFFNYSGLGYQNPAQQGIGNTGLRFGGNLKKNFLGNKVVLNVRGDVKNTPISSENGSHWKNVNVNIDSRFKLFKHYTFSLKYLDNGVSRVEDLVNPVYTSKKMQVDMNASYKIGKYHNVSYMSLGKQMMNNPGTPLMANSSFLSVVYSQNMVMNKIVLSGNLFYNKELNTVVVLGDMLNTDVNCQYSLLKGLSTTSSVTYLDNQNIARQVGLRQNVQLTLGEKVDVSAFVDVRKNLIDPLYPGLFGTGRGELSIRYYIK